MVQKTTNFIKIKEMMIPFWDVIYGLLVCSLLLVTSCAAAEKVTDSEINDKKPVVISKISSDEAVEIAKNEARRRGFKYVESEIRILWDREHWSVLLLDEQLTIGGHILILISPEGEVVRVLPGK